MANQSGINISTKGKISQWTLQKWMKASFASPDESADLLNEIKELIDLGLDITADNNYAIKWASEHGCTEVVKLLMAAGANVTVDDNWDIQYASEHGTTESIKALIEAGAKL